MIGLCMINMMTMIMMVSRNGDGLIYLRYLVIPRHLPPIILFLLFIVIFVRKSYRSSKFFLIDRHKLILGEQLLILREENHANNYDLWR
jgi:hypothetical protein